MSRKVQCLLCPFQCVLNPGERGVCQVRCNLDGKLVSLVYSRPGALNIDPVEKKPLFHFLPGSATFSLATAGCNLGCKFCQNWQLSQARPEDLAAYDAPPEKIVRLAKENGCRSVAYTYTEPVIFYEYALDTSLAARAKGLKNILVTAGFINPAPMRRLAKAVDAANVDIKSMSDDFYRNICSGGLKPVLRTCEICLEEGVILEVTNLIIPGLNDGAEDIRALIQWIKKNLGDRVPLHFSRFSPMYKLANLIPTPVETLIRARDTALDAGLKHVYIGNIYVKNGEDTFCASCRKKLVERRGYTISFNKVQNGKCPFCKTKIYGLWE